MISTRSLELVIDTVVCLTLAKWETVSGQFGGYLNEGHSALRCLSMMPCRHRYGGCRRAKVRHTLI
jgi:hypothetical protein